MKIIRWVFAAFFFLLALFFIPSLSSIFFLLSALLLVPLKKLQELIKKFIPSQKLRIAFVIVLALLSFILIPESNSSTKKYESDPVTEIEAEIETETETEAETETETDTKTETETETETEIKAETETETEAETESKSETSESLYLISVTSPVATNTNATVKVQGKPNTTYKIEVFYSSGASTAKGLEDKMSSNDGTVFWTWKVGNRTNPGTYDIVVSGGGEELKIQFTVTK